MLTELEEALEDYSKLAEEQDPYKEFDEKFLNSHTFRSNLIWIINTISKLSPENEDIIKALIVSSFATHDDYANKLHIFIRGDYASGKTHKAETVRSFLPFDNRVIDKVTNSDISSVSPKFVFYSTKNVRKEGRESIPDPTLYSNRVLYLDDVKAAEIEPLKKMTNTSEGAPTWSVTNKDNTGTNTYVLDGKPTIWMSKVEGFAEDDGQLTSRFYNIECLKEIEKVHNHILFNEVTEYDLTHQKRVKEFIAKRIKEHCTYNISREQLQRLPIPKDSNRNSVFELLCLKVITKINAVDLSIPLIPTEEDMIETLQMFQGKTSDMQITGVSILAKELLKDIHTKEWYQGDKLEGDVVGLTLNELILEEKYKNIKYRNLMNKINELEKAGYIHVSKRISNQEKVFYKIK